MNKRRSFTFSVVFWLICMGLFVCVRFIGTGFNQYFLHSNREGIFFWILGSLILATLFWLGLLIENLPAIRKQAYYELILLKDGLMVFAVIFITATVWISEIIGGTPVIEAISEYISWVFTPLMLVSFLYMFACAIIISFIWQMGIKIGPNVLMNLLLGKCHNPREEDRFFINFAQIQF